LVTEGIKLADITDTKLHIERRGDMHHVLDWVNQQTLELQAAGSVPL
jgi:hypothetical protein